MVKPATLPLQLSDLRGAIRLAADATAQVTGIVESMHATIASGAVLGPPRRRARGISGLVYRSIRGVAGQIGHGLSAVLEPATALWPATATSSVERDALLAALNGVIGDHLEATGNPLAIAMSFRRNGQPLPLERQALADALPEAGQDLLIMVHGLCMNDRQWNWRGHDHGAALAAACGYTPLYLHYNSGRHISTNGREFAERLQQLVDAWPVPVRSLSLLVHSMGGLVARSACERAEQQQMSWRAKLQRIAFLGTPHQGSPLERYGHAFQTAVGLSPFVAPLADLGRLRSAGITDLRHGSLSDADWQHVDRFTAAAPPRVVALPQRVRCYAIGAVRGRVDGLRGGDGLVPLRSALGQHADPARCLEFPQTRCWIGAGLGHWDLLDDPAVYARLLQWFAQTSNP